MRAAPSGPSLRDLRQHPILRPSAFAPFRARQKASRRDDSLRLLSRPQPRRPGHQAPHTEPVTHHTLGVATDPGP